MKAVSLLISVVCAFAIAFAASETDVRRSLNVRGIPEPDTIQMPDTASSDCTSLLEARFQALTKDSLWVRFRCREDRKPFYGALFYRSSSALVSAREGLVSHASSKRVPVAVVIRVGQVVQLVLRSGQVVLRRPVTSLQAGAVGEKIRVRDQDRRIYLASVKGEHLVEAGL